MNQEDQVIRISSGEYKELLEYKKWAEEMIKYLEAVWASMPDKAKRRTDAKIHLYL